MNALADGVLTKAAYEKKNAALVAQAADVHSRITKLEQRVQSVAAPPPTEVGG